MLAFDIDVKTVARNRVAPGTEQASTDSLRTAGVPTTPPLAPTEDSEYLYTWDDVQATIAAVHELQDFLMTHCNFTNIRIFDSGQGTHLYALDDDPDHRYTTQTRTVLTEYISDKLTIPIDGPVTHRTNSVLRIPRSLHTDVSRLVTEIHTPDFDPRTDPRALPTTLFDTADPTSTPDSPTNTN